MSDHTRREFLQASAAGLAVSPVFLSQAAEAAEKASPNGKIRIGLIGCGGISNADLRCFLSHPEVDCPIVCDVDTKRAAERAGMVKGARGNDPEQVQDFRRVIDRKDLDAVLICTPDHWHALPAVYACQAGKDVYVEKPLGQNIEEGRAMVTAAHENKRVMQMGTQWRSGEHFLDAVKFIQSGKLGTIRLVRAWAYLDWVGGIGSPADCDPPPHVDYDLWLGPAPKRPFNPNRFHFNFRWFWDYAGGLMTDWGVHLLNICLWAMGPETPLRVSSAGGKRIATDNSETPDSQVAVYDFPNYTLVFEQMTMGGLGPGGRPHGMLFNGTEGTVIIDGNGWEIIPEPKKESLQAAQHKIVTDGRQAHVDNFLECMKTREQPVENPELGHFVSTVAHLGNLALRTQREIRWNAEKERAEGNREANALVRANYRKPWKLPYT